MSFEHKDSSYITHSRPPPFGPFRTLHTRCTVCCSCLPWKMRWTSRFWSLRLPTWDSRDASCHNIATVHEIYSILWYVCKNIYIYTVMYVCNVMKNAMQCNATQCNAMQCNVMYVCMYTQHISKICHKPGMGIPFLRSPDSKRTGPWMGWALLTWLRPSSDEAAWSWWRLCHYRCGSLWKTMENGGWIHWTINIWRFQWGYPKKWMCFSGKSENEMDIVGELQFQETSIYQQVV